jgi:hypothetical protein
MTNDAIRGTFGLGGNMRCGEPAPRHADEAMLPRPAGGRMAIVGADATEKVPDRLCRKPIVGGLSEADDGFKSRAKSASETPPTSRH